MTLFPELIFWALTDSLGLATLLIPVWLLIDPSDRVTRTVAFYVSCVFLAYVLLALFASPVLLAVSHAWQTASGGLRDGVMLLVGVLCLGLSAVMALRDALGGAKSSRRFSEVRRRTLRSHDLRSMVTLVAITAPAESLTMFPYLAFMRRLDGLDYSFWERLFFIVIYCSVLVGPASIFLLFRWVLDRKARVVLEAVRRVLEENVNGVGKWIAFCLGLTLIFNALHVS